MAKSLEQLLQTNKPNALVERFIRWALTNYVTEENLIDAIQKNLDILALSLNHFHLGHPLVAPVFKLALQMFWTEFVENYIADVPKIYKVLSEKQACKVILDTPEGVDYLNRCCKASYESLYTFCWGEGETET